MGKTLLRKWLTVVCDKDVKDGEDHWKELILFLEREMKICQKEVVLSSRMKTPRRRVEPSHHVEEESASGNSSSQACSICEATDHTKTPGHNGKKLIQYYVCKKFIEWTCKQRFDFLKQNNLCYQCLYPSANNNNGKHKEGRCQRDFTCKHESHNMFTKKKHVLVCDEHKHTAENKTLLDDYKRRFILRDDVRLPPISRSILIHYISSSDGNSSDEDLSHVLPTTACECEITNVDNVSPAVPNNVINFASPTDIAVSAIHDIEQSTTYLQSSHLDSDPSSFSATISHSANVNESSNSHQSTNDVESTSIVDQ